MHLQTVIFHKSFVEAKKLSMFLHVRLFLLGKYSRPAKHGRDGGINDLLGVALRLNQRTLALVLFPVALAKVTTN